MKYILNIAFLVCFNLHLIQAAVERNSRAGQEKRIADVYPSHGRQQDAICTLEDVLEIRHCMKDMVPFIANGFPWGLTDVTGVQNEIRNQQKQSDNFGDRNNSGNFSDPFGALNHVCHMFGDFLRCLDQHAIASECLLSGSGLFSFHTVFQYICNVQPRSTDLLHSLQCLDRSRVLDLLLFYLAQRPGTHVDDMAQGTVNALFTFFNHAELVFDYGINPLALNDQVSTGLICLPESVISDDISFIIDRKCGSHTADLVRDFYLYFRTDFSKALDKIGQITTNICDKGTTRRNPDVDKRSYAAQTTLQAMPA